MRNALVLISILLAAVAGCTVKAGAERPAFVDRLIAELEAEPKKNPPARILQYRYKGQVVFYVPPSCCDVPSDLYDSNGARICSPDGGMGGDGDGKCPDFFDTRSEERLVWSDPR